MVNYKLVSEKLLAALNEIIPNVNEMDCDPQEGLLLSHDEHVITVKTGFQPTEVFVSVTDEDIQTCGGDISTVSASIIEDGFVLYANIKSDKAMVRWIVK